MSFRRRQSLRLRPVNSIKHIVDSNGGVTGAGQSVTDVVQAQPVITETLSNRVLTGSLVYAIYLRVEVIQEVAAAGIDNIYMYVFKNPSGNLATPAVDGIGVTDKRRFVLHQEMVMTGNVLSAAQAIPRILFKGVITLPRNLRRFGVDDKLQVVIGHRTGEATQVSNFCLQCIYKEFR